MDLDLWHQIAAGIAIGGALPLLIALIVWALGSRLHIARLTLYVFYTGCCFLNVVGLSGSGITRHPVAWHAALITTATIPCVILLVLVFKSLSRPRRRSRGFDVITIESATVKKTGHDSTP
jgi:hypothetical protein